MQLVHNLRPVSIRRDSPEPHVCELGEERARVCADVVRVDKVVQDMCEDAQARYEEEHRARVEVKEAAKDRHGLEA